MNYRHAFHAGNFADVLKHVVLLRVLLHLREKQAAFRVIDTHAGAGRYDLADEAARRTGEWKNGIGRLLDAPPGGEAGALIEPYLALVRRTMDGGSIYPGSPLLALSLARPQDRLILCELHPEERAALEAAVAGDRRVKVLGIDGWTALKAQLPPPERRGLVLIDPPFEDAGDFRRFEQGLQEAQRRWTTGVYLFWYPVKAPAEAEAFARRVARLGIPRILRIELGIGGPAPDQALRACGLLAVNPPWTLEGDLGRILPLLAHALGRGGAGRHRCAWLAR